MKSFQIFLRVSAWLLLGSISAFAVVQRHQISIGDANISGFQSLGVSVPNSADCAGSSYGTTKVTNTWIVGGCRGSGFIITNQYKAIVSGQTVNGDRAYMKFTLKDGTFFGLTLYNNAVNTNAPCNVLTFNTANSGHIMYGSNKVEFIYETDGTWNQGLSAYQVAANVTAVHDVHGDIVFDVETLAADGKSKAHPRVTEPYAYPEAVLRWDIIGESEEQTLGCTIDEITGEITAGEVSGRIVVRAYNNDLPDCFIEAELQVGCDPCVASGCMEGSVGVSSVEVSISAGKAAFGKSAGLFRIKEEVPSTLLSTPAALKYYIGANDTNEVVVVKTNGYVRQVLAPQTLANVVSNSAHEYVIEFYAPGDYGTAKDGSGLFPITGSAETTWTIRNPDGGSSFNRLEVIKAGGSSVTNEYVWDNTLHGWELISDGGRRKEKRYSTTNGLFRTEYHFIRNQSDVVKFEETKIFQTFTNWNGEELISHTLGSGTNALTTTYSYHTNAADPNNFSRLFQVVRPSNHWERNYYDSKGRNIRTITQYINNPIPTTTGQENANRVKESYYYTTNDQFFTFLNGYETTWRRVDYENNLTTETQEQTAGNAYDPSLDLTTYTLKYVSGPFAGEIEAILNPDQTMSFYNYELSTNGLFRTNTVDTGETDSGGTIVINGTRTISVFDQGGNRISEKAYDIASGLLISSTVTLSSDAYGRPLAIQYLDGTTETNVYDCCGLSQTIDRQGVSTFFQYDYLKRATNVTRDGISTWSEYDAAGNLVKTTRVGTDASKIVLDESAYDTVGRLLSLTEAPNGSGTNRVTTISEYFDGSNNRIKTTTYPDSGTRVETFYPDGSLFTVTGTAAQPLKYLYGMGTQTTAWGEITREILVGSNSEETEWSQTLKDAMGRVYLTQYAPLPSQGATFTRSYFNNGGQIWKERNRDGIFTLYIYNAKGEREYTAIDIGGTDVVNVGGSDRVTRTVSDVYTNSTYGAAVRRTRQYVWPILNNSTPELIQTSETSVNDSRTWNIAFGLTNRTQSSYLGSGVRVVTSTTPDESYSISRFLNDRITSSTNYTAQSAVLGFKTYGYDSHSRLNAVTDARNGTSDFTLTDADQIRTIATPAPSSGASRQVTTNFYDGKDRVWKTALPDGSSVTSEFYFTDLLKKTYGSRTYPVEYSYDSQGRIKTMVTWQNFSSGTGTATNKWHYHPQWGYLTNKVDQNNQGELFTYKASGKTATRTGARGITTAYNWNSVSGDLSSVDYSDSTPDVTFSRDRMGRATNIVQSGQLTTVLSLNLAGQTLSESYTSGVLNGRAVTNGYDSLLRRNAVAVDGYGLTYSTFHYGDASRLQTVSNGVNSATYAYVTNSDLIGTVTFKNSGTTRMTTIRQYDFLNRLTSISSGAESFAYAHNSANQRTSVTLADGSSWIYEYDSLGQLTSARRYWADGTPVMGQQFEYSFDDIGNRKTAKSGGNEFGTGLRSASYSVNSLNQYTNRVNPGTFDIIGDAHSNALVTVNFQDSERHQNYFWKELSANNSSAPVFVSVTNFAVLLGGTNADIVSTNIGSMLLPKASETLTYDLDGNLTSDSLWTNKWNALDQLTEMESVSTVPSAAKQKLEFVYDYLGRRIRKIVRSGWNGSAYTTQTTNKFLWNGSLLLSELDGSDNLIRSYVWGLDVSGTSEGVSGVGGLLAVNTAAQGAHFVTYAGNGNVVALMDASLGSISAQFTYDPFGNFIGAIGSMADEMPLTFSTRYHDSETGCYYWGLRYGKDGRWLSRDPLGEMVSRNLYGFTKNDPVNFFDPLGGREETEWEANGMAKGDYERLQREQQSIREANSFYFDIIIAVGANATYDGIQRKVYEIAEQRLKQRTMEFVRSGRMNHLDALKWYDQRRKEMIEVTRAKSTPLGRFYANWKKPMDSIPSVEERLAKSGRTAEQTLGRATSNAGVNRAGSILRVGGSVCFIAGLTFTAVDIVTTPEGQRGRRTSNHVGATVGGLAFGYAGAKGGGAIGTSIAGPVGTLIGGGIGFVGGSTIGAFTGGKAGENYYDAFVDE